MYFLSLSVEGISYSTIVLVSHAFCLDRPDLICEFSNFSTPILIVILRCYVFYNQEK